MSVASCPGCRKGPPSPPDPSAPAAADAARRCVSSARTFISAAARAVSGSAFAAAARPIAALLLALSAAPALASDPADGGVRLPEPGREIVHPEGSVARVLTLPPGDWRLSGPDADLFRIEAGAQRLSVRTDFETPGDADGDNLLQLVLVRADAGDAALPLAVRVTDRDEPGRAVLEPRRPSAGEPVTAALFDPDRDAGAPALSVRWEPWISPGQWQAIPDAHGPAYVPTSADVGRPLRAVLSYSDRHGPGRSAVTEPTHPVLGPALLGLDARADGARSMPAGEDASMRPAFDPRITEYGLRCAERDVVTVSFSAPPDVRVSVNGVQPAPGRDGAAAVSVTPESDVALAVSASDGARTTYTVHCMPPELWKIRTEPDPARPLGVLLALATGPWAAVIDGNGVSRAHVRAEGGTAGFLLRPFGSGPDLRWAHFGQVPKEGRKATGELLHRWRVRDRTLTPLRTVSTALPLTTTGRHDFRLLEDGSTLLMTYEPSVRDLTGFPFPDADGNPFGAEVEMEDSAIQLLGPDGTVRWTWSSWGRLPLEDCAQHRFPGDWAHVNSIQWTDRGVLASFRGCSAILMIDPDAAPGEEILWRTGASNLGPEDWRERGLGPPPLRIVGDPEGAFCGQHAAQLLPPPPGLALPRLLMFDNGAACVTDPRTGEPLGRESGVYSRAVEYALDLGHGEAVFVRDHALGGARDMYGHAGGHVAPLADGGWLVSWGNHGRGSPESVGCRPPADGVTRVDPDAGIEGFRIPVDGGVRLRALPVSPLALMRAPGALDAVLPDVPPSSHVGAGDRVEIAVAFSRPVAAFGPDTGSVEVAGGALARAEPLDAFGRPAHAWRLVLAPSGDAPLELRFRPRVACAGEAADDAPDPASGICTTDGTRLGRVPDALAIPGPSGKAAAERRTANAGEGRNNGQE